MRLIMLLNVALAISVSEQPSVQQKWRQVHRYRATKGVNLTGANCVTDSSFTAPLQAESGKAASKTEDASHLQDIENLPKPFHFLFVRITAIQFFNSFQYHCFQPQSRNCVGTVDP